MPRKNKRMTEEHKQRVREGVYRHMYGPDWEGIVKERKEAELLRVGQAAVKVVTSTAPKDEYGNPLEGIWVPPLGKREFCRMLIVRLRGELPNREFVEIAKLYSDIRHWTNRKGTGQDSQRSHRQVRSRLERAFRTSCLVIRAALASRSRTPGQVRCSSATPL